MIRNKPQRFYDPDDQAQPAAPTTPVAPAPAPTVAETQEHVQQAASNVQAAMTTAPDAVAGLLKELKDGLGEVKAELAAMKSASATPTPAPAPVAAPTQAAPKPAAAPTVKVDTPAAKPRKVYRNGRRVTRNG